jgi:hypothetical protein
MHERVRYAILEIHAAARMYESYVAPAAGAAARVAARGAAYMYRTIRACMMGREPRRRSAV